MGAQVKIIDVNGEVLIGKEFVSTVQFLELPLRQEKMKKYFIIISILLFSTCALATSVDISTYFQKQSGCFILFDVNENKLIKKYTPARCAERISPDSTFKIPLSLMAFDQSIITQQTIFKWDGKDKGSFPGWNQDQTPQSWFKYSAVWVSREITSQLGMKKIKYYLKKFNYGNQDFSGDVGENNGLMGAWLSGSLKISAMEQLQFIKSLVENTLPISPQAMRFTKENLFIETSPRGWNLYGKTGSGHYSKANHVFRDGWFVGFVQKGKKTVVFITNFTDIDSSSTEYAGPQVKMITKQILTDSRLF